MEVWAFGLFAMVMSFAGIAWPRIRWPGFSVGVALAVYGWTRESIALLFGVVLVFWMGVMLAGGKNSAEKSSSAKSGRGD